MTPKARISLVVIQAMTAAITLLMFGVGLLAVKGMQIMEGKEPSASEMMYDSKMRPIIGKQYTEETH